MMTGPDRCYMRMGRLGPKLVKGSYWIELHITKGWEIVEDERNHLNGNYGNGGGGRPAVEVRSNVVRNEDPATQPKKKRKRIGQK